MTKSMTTGLAGPILAMSSVHFLPAAKSGTFFARDNVSNFIAWCRWVSCYDMPKTAERVIVMLIAMIRKQTGENSLSITRFDAGFIVQLTEISTAWNQAVQKRKMRWSMECLCEKKISWIGEKLFYDVVRLIDHCSLIYSNECLWRIIFHSYYFHSCRRCTWTHNDPINDNNKTQKCFQKEKRHRHSV